MFSYSCRGDCLLYRLQRVSYALNIVESSWCAYNNLHSNTFAYHKQISTFVARVAWAIKKYFFQKLKVQSISLSDGKWVCFSVTGLVYLRRSWLKIFLQKNHTCLATFGLFWKRQFESKNWCGYFLCNFGKMLCFLLQHLVTLMGWHIPQICSYVD